MAGQSHNFLSTTPPGQGSSTFSPTGEENAATSPASATDGVIRRSARALRGGFVDRDDGVAVEFGGAVWDDATYNWISRAELARRAVMASKEQS